MTREELIKKVEVFAKHKCNGSTHLNYKQVADFVLSQKQEIKYPEIQKVSSDKDIQDTFDSVYNSGWNACIDKMKELNK